VVREIVVREKDIQEGGKCKLKKEDKLLFLNDLLEKNNSFLIQKNIDFINSLSKDFSWEVRSLVAKVCCISDDKKVLDILLSLADDKNNMVRLEAADSLCSFADILSYKKLITLCDDYYYMVRGYAEYGIGFVGRVCSKQELSLKIIREKIEQERLYYNKLQCYMALYFLDDKDALKAIMNVYKKLRYQDKCLVVNFILEILSEDNKDQILPFFMAYGKCGVQPVDSLINRLFEKI
jgi:HEAT repeat protein